MEGRRAEVLQGNLWQIVPPENPDRPYAEWFEEVNERFIPLNVPQSMLDRGPSVLKCMTLNVMMDWWKGSPYAWDISHPKLRYKAVREHIRGNAFDLVFLNEVTKGFLCQLDLEDYVSTAGTTTGHVWTDMGNVILVRRSIAHCISGVYSFSLPMCPRHVVGVTMKPRKREEDDIFFMSAHLSALSSNKDRRKMQLESLVHSLPPHARRVVVAGDLNFHSLDEVRLCVPPGYGCSPDVITFDGTTNRMMQHLWPLGYEKRQMCLDRIITSSASDLTLQNVHVCLNHPLFQHEQQQEQESGFLRRLMEQVRMVGSGDPKNYLYASDHFGLTFQVVTKKKEQINN